VSQGFLRAPTQDQITPGSLSSSNPLRKKIAGVPVRSSTAADALSSDDDRVLTFDSRDLLLLDKGKPFARGGRKASGLSVADSGVTENSEPLFA
jgi:hypothetical protein